MGKNIDDNTGIWNPSILHRHKLDEGLVRGISLMQIPASLADLGCGVGQYMDALRKSEHWGDCEMVGYEGTPGIQGLTPHDVKIVEMDLSSHQAPAKYPMVLCLEVGEHIPKAHEHTFIQNVSRFCGSVLILSWAPPGQYSASGHVNLRDEDYVMRAFIDEGFEPVQTSTEQIREHATLEWFKKNIIVFRRRM